MKVALCVLALLAVASTASATFPPWYLQTLFRNRCFVPGCDQCADYKPYTCERCSDGYALLKDNTCGCAAGFGSYVQPPQPGYPYLPPHSCPSWVVSSNGRVTKTGVRSTLPNGRASSPVSLKTWYLNKPGFCTQTYIPSRLCQGVIPFPAIGYCQCFRCPAGTNSTGGPIASMAAGCTPAAQPVVRCMNAPPQIPNAKPWGPKCRSIKTNKACTTTCNAGFVAQPANSSLTAKCGLGGVWQTTGSCVAAGAACKGSPATAPNAIAFANCTDGNAGATCSSTCAAGFEGSVTATCNAASGSWVVTGTCKAAAATCSGSPSSDNADFAGCADLKAGATCDGVCADGSAITATCGNDGKYTITGTCAATAACPGTPTSPENGNPFETNQNGAPCTDGAVNDACQATCKDGFTGSVDAICQADGAGWSVIDNCVQGGGGGGDVTCAGLPEDASADNAEPWPETCADLPADETCTGTCAAGFNGDGSFATSYCAPDGTWQNNIECVPEGKKKRIAGL